MPPKKTTFETVRAIASTLPGVEESTMYGSPALKVRGSWIVVVPTHKSAEPNSLAFRVDVAQREELIAAEPRTYYVKEHYVNYPVVLVRLAEVHPDALEDLVRMAYRRASATRKQPARRASASPRKAKRR